MKHDKKKLKKFIRKTLGVKVTKYPIYAKAFTHKSIEPDHSNERLEFLGDAILSGIIAEHIFNIYPTKDEGDLTQIKSNMESRKQLNRIGAHFGLSNYVLYNDTPKGHKNIEGNTLEALIGALFIDKGAIKTKKVVMKKIIKPYFNMKHVEKAVQDFKTQMIIWGQKEKKTIEFDTNSIKAQQIFEAKLMIDGKLISTAKGETKKKAEKKASEKAFKLPRFR